MKILRNFFKLIYALCYAAGLFVLAPFRLTARKFRRLRDRLRIDRRTLSAGYVKSVFATFVFLGLILVGSVYGAQLVASGQRLKGQVLGSADAGLGHWNGAKTALEQQDATAASLRLGQALQSFEQSRKDLNSNNLVLQNLLDLVPQKQDADNKPRMSREKLQVANVSRMRGVCECLAENKDGHLSQE